MPARRGDGRIQQKASDHLIRKGQAMIDVINKTPLRVNKNGTANASIDLSVDQLPEVQKLLDDHAIRYWVAGSYLSVNGSPFQAVILPSKTVALL